MISLVISFVHRT